MKHVSFGACHLLTGAQPDATPQQFQCDTCEGWRCAEFDRLSKEHLDRELLDAHRNALESKPVVATVANSKPN